MFQQAEQAIVDRLLATAELSDVRVMAWPESPLSDATTAKGSGAVYVRFSGLSLQPERCNRSPFVQAGTIEFEIRLLVKDLRSHTGAYPLIEAIHKRLSGFRLPGVEPYSFGLAGLELTTAELVDRLDKFAIWDWGLRLQTSVVFTTYLEG